MALPAPAGQPFAATLARLRSGDEAAWAELYRGFSPRVLGFLRGLGATDAEDLMGEVFVQVVRDLWRFEGDERAFRAWLFTVAHHRLLDAKRRARRRPFELFAKVPEDPAARGDVTDDAFGELERTEVMAVLGRLSRDQRAVLLLRIVGDLTVEEVARAVGKRPGAVKALQRRGLAAVRREIEGGRTPVLLPDAVAG
jgi:RNA polymerase sigma factor (sigma-70 family)